MLLSGDYYSNPNTNEVHSQNNKNKDNYNNDSDN